MAAYVGEEALETFRKVRQEFDPESLLSTGLGERLALV